MTSFSKHLFASLYNHIELQSAFLSQHNFPSDNVQYNPDITSLLLPKWKVFLQSFFADGHIDLSKTLQEISIRDSYYVWLNLALRKADSDESEPFLSLCYKPNDFVSLDNLFHHIDESSLIRSHHPYSLYNAQSIELPFYHSVASNVIRHPHRLASLTFDIHALQDIHANCAHFSKYNRNILTFDSASCPAFPSSIHAFADELINSCRPLFKANMFPSEHRIQLHRIRPGGLSLCLPDCDDNYMPEYSLLFFFIPPSIETPSMRIFHTTHKLALAEYPMNNNSTLFIQRTPHLKLQQPEPLCVLKGHTCGLAHCLCIHLGQQTNPNISSISQEDLLEASPTRIFYV